MWREALGRETRGEAKTPPGDFQPQETLNPAYRLGNKRTHRLFTNRQRRVILNNNQYKQGLDMLREKTGS